MLIDFSFSNFRSFRDEQAFSMSRSDTKLPPSTVTAVYGANASGKSNFLKALNAMANMVRTSYIQGQNASGVQRDAYMLFKDEEESKACPSTFLAEFIANDEQRYCYWFTFDSEKIINEELTVFRKLGDRLSTRATLLFSRDENETKYGHFFGPSALLEQIMIRRPNALILSAAAAAGVASTQPAFDFFNMDIVYCEALAFEAEEPIVTNEFSKHTDFSRHLSELIHYADFGIDTMDAVPVNFIPDSQALENFKKQIREDLGADQEKLDKFFSQNSVQSQQQVQLRFAHAGENGILRQFTKNQESEGTLGALSFFSLALRQLSRQTVTLVDEIDTSLHPLLVREFVSLFTDPDTNLHNSQLIFTTHDISLINVSATTEHLLDSDQIWLVEKDDDGASEIYPLTDMKLRSKENIGKNYMNGVYGAVPRSGFHSLFARIMNEENDAGNHRNALANIEPVLGGEPDE